MYIKKIILSAIFMISISIGLQASCYQDWYDSYNEAERNLSLDISRCGKATWTSRCSYEAKLSYGVKIDKAGETYHRCIRRR